MKQKLDWNFCSKQFQVIKMARLNQEMGYRFRSWPTSLPPPHPPDEAPTKSPWHTAEKWHQLISIHEPFTWAPLCLKQGLIQTEAWLFGSLQTAAVGPLYAHIHWHCTNSHSLTLSFAHLSSTTALSAFRRWQLYSFSHRCKGEFKAS